MSEDGLSFKVLQDKMSIPRRTVNEGQYDRDTGGLEDLWELLRDMGSHIVVLRVLRARSIEVETSTSTKVPTVVFSFDACSAGGRVREEDGDTLSRGVAQECTFLRAKLGCDDARTFARRTCGTYALSSVQVKPER